MKGYFITFEGIDGCGKSTQADLLEQSLKDRGCDVTHTFEPGGTALGRKLRPILTDGGTELSLFAEVLLFAADRRQDMDEVILPALGRGGVVIGERFADSSIVYQGVAGNVGRDRVRNLMSIVTDGLVPDLTFLLDIAPEHSLARKTSLDRIEQRDRFLGIARQAYLELAHEDAARFVVLDASRAIEALSQDILDSALLRLEHRRYDHV